MKAGIRSMTGFAEAVAEDHGRVARASVRSVNHRFLDLRVNLPEGLESLDPVVRRAARGKARRGHLDVFIRLESAGPPEVRVNREAAAMYLKTMSELMGQFGLRNEPDLAGVLRLPGVVESAATADPAETERLAAIVERAMSQAMERLDEMRRAEGARLAADLEQSMARLGAHVAGLESLAERARPAYAERLRERLGELLADTTVEPARLVQEAAIVASRSDATEEITRLKSHLDEFTRALGSPGEAGKTLDFVCQEMQREINTMLSKAPALGPDGLEITRAGLAVKAEIEKLREQVQNIE